MREEEAIAALSKLRAIMDRHNNWRRRETINLIPSENVMSPLAEYFYLNDMMGRYAEGTIGKRYYQGVSLVDEAEQMLVDLMSSLFSSRFTDVRPISGTVANMAVYHSVAGLGEKIASLPTAAGGHISHNETGAPKAFGLRVSYLPWSQENFNVDVDAARRLIAEERPKLVLLGASLYLFPHPIKELADAAHEVGAVLMHDSAHVLGLIAGHQFPNPLELGADIMTSSTHKTFPGPQGGVIFTTREDLFKEIQRSVFPVMTSNYHLHRYASTIVTAIEMSTYGDEYAATVRSNAKALAEQLHANGLPVVAEEHGFTATHQVAMDVSKFGGGGPIAKALEDANIIVNKNMLPWDKSPVKPSGIRMGVQEMTRMGMGKGEMAAVAELIAKVVIKGVEPSKVKPEVVELRRGFTKVRYGFDLSTLGLNCPCLPLL
ncbi:serine hydroxymethyltransferase [Thermocladium modestius]|uniref:Serine hydroxymethyltransferase n=1 Tax=Thermocladium modestius TaxID=62609 RepID=A0A830GVT1_9CREN|nr:serine hydroxymethyltransferase [Thermocladium modestius]GGP20207.1 serine hydroxymethyltransferase [Thermocladium modestius]